MTNEIWVITNESRELNWSNRDGWVSSGYDRFSGAEHARLSLPIGGQWVQLESNQSEDHSLANALAWFQSIKEMVDALESAEKTGEDSYIEQERATIQESVLSVEVRSGWFLANAHPSTRAADSERKPAEYRILLTTGGPACQLVGELNEHGEPETAYLEHQDWGTPWTEVSARQLAFASDKEAHTGESYNEGMERQAKGADEAQTYLLTFARQFYFGEG